MLDVLNATGITPNFNSIHPGAAGNHCNAADPYNFTHNAGYIAEWEIIQRVRDRVVKSMMVMPFVLE